jgi:hypothetical protein
MELYFTAVRAIGDALYFAAAVLTVIVNYRSRG